MSDGHSSKEELFKDTQVYKTPHEYPPTKATDALQSDPKNGLNSDEAASRLQKFGPNEIPKVKTSIWKLYIAPISNWLINIYLLAAFVIFILSLSVPSPYTSPITGETLSRGTVYLTLIPWFVVIGINCIVAVIQQYRGQKKLEALQELIAQKTMILREGEKIQIKARNIVPGDVIILTQGDKVPADSILLESHELLVNEASLTGESSSVEKKVSHSGLKGDAPVHERSNMVFMGTFVTKGSAKCLAVNTGSETIIGDLSKNLEAVTTGEIPIRSKVNALAKYLGIGVLILLLLSVTTRIYSLLKLASSIAWFDLAYIVINATILALTIMPINIVLLVTVVLLTGVLAMAEKKVVVRDLSAVESLGRVSVICSDKTGTLTANKMTVKWIWDCDTLYGVTGTGFEKDGSIVKMREEYPARSIKEVSELPPIEALSQSLKTILLNGYLNNDAKVKNEKIMGDPTDGACKVLFHKSPLNEEEVKQEHKVMFEFPFDSGLKRMTKAFKGENGNIAFVKGATEVILDQSTKIIQGDNIVEMTEEKRREIRERVNHFAGQGYRVISFAYKLLEDYPNGNIEEERDHFESELIYSGFVCILDPPRPGVHEAVKDCHSAGIDVVMVTGDAPLTAKYIAEDLGIINDEDHRIVEGGELNKLDEEEFTQVRVFARVNPQDKQEIVKQYQDRDKVVAMTGDGVNDALAVGMSDCGISMGREGTDVTKQASDIIITDDAFTSIRTGVEEGRNLFSKIRAMCYFFICINIMEALVLFGLFFLFGLSDPTYTPFLNFQLQWLTVSSHTFPSFALIFDKSTDNVMDEPPRDTEAIINWPLFKLLILHALLMAAGALIVYLTSITGLYQVFPSNIPVFHSGSLTLQKARTMTICILVLVESLTVFPIRRVNQSIMESNKGEDFALRVYLLIALVLIGTVGLIYFPSVQRLAFTLTNGILKLSLMRLTWLDWIVIILVALLSIMGVELYKWRKREKGERF